MRNWRTDDLIFRKIKYARHEILPFQNLHHHRHHDQVGRSQSHQNCNYHVCQSITLASCDNITECVLVVIFLVLITWISFEVETQHWPSNIARIDCILKLNVCMLRAWQSGLGVCSGVRVQQLLLAITC